MNDIVLNQKDKIENLIYEIRGKQIMLDSDLAKLYKCANGTKTINLAVKRHINRFPERFMFQLTIEEVSSISRFQIETLKGQGHNIKYLPYAFTEQGVAMLATILRTSVAEEVSIKIMDAFVAMRKYMGANLIEQKYINNLVLEDHDKIKVLEKSFQKLEEKRKDSEIYFNGQIYDAYSKILDIFKSEVTIITRKNNLLSEQDIEKYNKQYHNLTIKYDNTFHDRYFIIDNKIVYHCGASINRIGYKTFSITLINDKALIKALIDRI